MLGSNCGCSGPIFGSFTLAAVHDIDEKNCAEEANYTDDGTNQPGKCINIETLQAMCVQKTIITNK